MNACLYLVWPSRLLMYYYGYISLYGIPLLKVKIVMVVCHYKVEKNDVLLYSKARNKVA